MRYVSIIILLVLCLTFLLFTGCRINTVKPEPASGNLEKQEDINQSRNNSQNSSTGLVYETVIVDTGESVTVYPQQWATGDGTVENPWANDCIQKAYDFVPDGGTIFLKAGYYTLSDTITIAKKINLIGEGMNKSIIILDIAHDSGIRIVTDYCTLKGFTIDGDSQTDGEQYLSPIVLTDCDYALIKDIELKNGGYYGLNIYQVNHSLFENIYARDNYYEGMHPGSNTEGRNIYNTYRDIYVWDNGGDGFYDRGYSEGNNVIEECYNVYDNIQARGNGKSGIAIQYQKVATISNCYSTDNGWKGFDFATLSDSNISNCVATFNATTSEDAGILLSGSNLNLTNVIVLNNYSGFVLYDCTDVRFTSCQAYDDRETPLQDYGLKLGGTNTGISLLNCKLSPNSLGEIYNPAGVEVTVIIEKWFLLLSL